MWKIKPRIGINLLHGIKYKWFFLFTQQRMGQVFCVLVRFFFLYSRHNHMT